MAAEPTTRPAAAAGTATIGDLTVNRLALGAMRMTGPGVIGEPDDPENALAVLRRAVELGINFIDTADSYGPEVNERQIAEALHPYPEGLVIATKGGLLHERRGEWRQDGRPESLRAACEGSLKRLRLERIDLYQLHSVDPSVPIEDSVGALVELQQEGKIRHIGLSNVSVRQLATARRVASIVSVQNRYSVADRPSEAVLDACERDGLAFLPWFPLGFGELARSSGRLAEVASAHGGTPAQIALAWLLRRSPVMVPIPGTSTLEHLEENVAAAALELTDAEFDDLSGSAGAAALMVLSDRTIRRLIDEGRIEIDPYDESLLQPSSVDVRVDRFFRVFHNARYPFIDVKEPQEDLTELVEIEDDSPFILHPGEFVLASSLERIRLPDDLVGRLEGKSSLGRLGLLIHSTAGFIDPGWDGHVTLELSNVANLPITIYYAMKIGQLSFVQLSEPAERPYGSGELGSKYQGQKGPTPSRYWQNFEREPA